MAKYTDFKLSDTDLKVINDLKKHGPIKWDRVELDGIKSNIKTIHLGVQGSLCCYCRKSFVDEFNMVIDIEHILPISPFYEYMFLCVNLSVSCKRCNMRIKKNKLDFIDSSDFASLKYRIFDKTIYKMIHPNLDVYRDNLELIGIVINNMRFTKYMHQSATSKGKFTYDFFELRKLEVDNLDKAQGLRDLGDRERVRSIRQMLDI